LIYSYQAYTYSCLDFCHLSALYMFIYFHAHIAKRSYILLFMYTYKCLHISTTIYALCISTYFYAHIAVLDYIIYVHVRPIHFYILLRPYVPNTCLNTSTPIYFYMIISHLRLYMPLYVYILLCPYTYSYIDTHIYI